MKPSSETRGSAHRPGAWVAVALLLALGAPLASSCRPGGDRDEEHDPLGLGAQGIQPPRDVTASAPAFAGRQACAECHVREAERWAGSHHDLAMQEVDERTVLGDFDDATVTYAGTTSRFFRRDGRFLVATDGPDGALREYEIAYVFGVTPLQQYLVPLPGGRLQALGIAWDARPAAAGGQRWVHLYPDEAVTHGDALHWTKPSQNWNDRCAACHSTGLRKRYRADADRYDTTWAEIDVSCEACHGPGSAHVAWARAAASAALGGAADAEDARSDGTALAEAARAPARSEGVPEHPGAAPRSRRRAESTADGAGATGPTPRRNVGLVLRFPARADWMLDATRPTARRAAPLASRAEVEACAPCHARRGEIAGDVVAGTPFLDAHEPAFLEDGLYFADGQIRDEVYEWGSFLQSRMYAAGVTCSDCHDPHSLRLRAEDNALCTGCHRAAVFDVAAHHFHPAGSPGARCIACHMPARTYMLVDERRDHGFRVPRPDLSERLGVPNACQACHADRTAAWAAEVVSARTGGARLGSAHFGDALAAGRGFAADAVARLVALAGDPAQPAIARATALESLRGSPDPAALTAIARGAGAADPLLRLAAMRALAGGAAAAAPLAAPRLRDPLRAVRLAAARALAGAPPSLLTAADVGALQTVLADYEAGRRAAAGRPETLAALAELHVRLGRIADAERALETAIQRAPYFVPARVNLADIRRAQGRDAEGEEILRAALAEAPEVAETHHALGLLLVRRGNLPAALAELARAAALAPGEPRYAYVLGVTLHSTGESERALAVLRAAHERAPGDRDLLLALATISRDRGERDAARGYANALAASRPWDRQARALEESLRARRVEPIE